MSQPSSLNPIGAVFIALATAVWATDSIFLLPVSQKIGPSWALFFQHLIVILAFLPWVLFNSHILKTLSFLEWVGAAFLGIGASCVAPLLYAASFESIAPSFTNLLSRAEPFLTTFFAILLLRERPGFKFYLWATLAAFSSVSFGFPDLNFSFLSQTPDPASRGMLYASAAVSIWGISVVIAKALLGRKPLLLIVFWKFFFGLIGAAAVLVVSKHSIQVSVFKDAETLRLLAYSALVTGLLGTCLYYYGLSMASASLSSFTQLLTPLFTVAIGVAYLDSPLLAVQIFSGALLILSIAMLSTARS